MSYLVPLLIAGAIALFFLRKWVFVSEPDYLHPDVHVDPVPESFDWTKQMEAKVNPVKPTYRTMMNVSPISHADWLVIDEDYDRFTKEKAKGAEEHPELLCIANDSPETQAAVNELYQYTLTTYVRQFPMIFVYKGGQVFNKIQDRILPLGPAADRLSSVEKLRLLNSISEDDFFVLLFDNDREEYILRAFTGYDDPGFHWVSKFNQPLSEIHERVPEYESKLRAPMTKSFNRIKENQFIRRVNWSPQIGLKHQIFLPRRSYVDPTNVTPDRIMSRCEQQTVLRLPKTKALIFTIHTYMYYLSETKAEGKGPLLADMMESLIDPVAEYKGRDNWAHVAVPYLRASQ